MFYNPFSAAKTGFPFSFSPFALAHPITEAPDQFYLRNMTDARYYLQQFGIGPRLIAIELINLLIFLVFYLGTRFFGLLHIPFLFVKKQLKKYDFIFISTILLSIFLTVTLVQKGVWWNTIQFFFYGIFLSTIYLAKLTFNFFNSKKKLLIILGIIILFLSVPTSFDVINHVLKESKAVYLPKNEIDALAFLRKQPDGVVFSPLKTEPLAREESFPMNKYADSGYIAAFSGKQIYLAEVQSLSVTGIDYRKRLEKVNRLNCSILKEVNYIYDVKGLHNKNRILTKCKNKKARKIYDNMSVSIYRIM